MTEWTTLERALRELHRKLLDHARADYAREHARTDGIGPGELLMLATRDDSFAWLRSLSELMADIDHLRGLPREQVDAGVRAAIRGAVEQLLTPPAEGQDASTFAQKYWQCVQQDPDVTIAHAAVKQALQAWPAPAEASAAAGDHRQLVAETAARRQRAGKDD